MLATSEAVTHVPSCQWERHSYFVLSRLGSSRIPTYGSTPWATYYPHQGLLGSPLMGLCPYAL